MILALMQAHHLQVSHFTAAVVFAFFASVVFGVTQRSNAREMVRYAGYCFVFFVGGLFVMSWIMWLLHH
jgi:protein-S-isoprenylcysteine O-methyltransferase Ste14